MSQRRLNVTGKLFDTSVDAIVFGTDHALGYFIQGYFGNECVVDRDSMGMGLVPHPLACVPLKKMELVEAFENLGLPTLANRVMLDLSI